MPRAEPVQSADEQRILRGQIQSLNEAARRTTAAHTARCSKPVVELLQLCKRADTRDSQETGTCSSGQMEASCATRFKNWTCFQGKVGQLLLLLCACSASQAESFEFSWLPLCAQYEDPGSKLRSLTRSTTSWSRAHRWPRLWAALGRHAQPQRCSDSLHPLT